MIIVKLTGGLGNQMFQYAAGRQLSLEHNTELKLDLTFFTEYERYGFIKRTYGLENFNIINIVASDKEIADYTKRSSIRSLNSVANRILGRKKGFLFDDTHRFNESMKRVADNTYLEGYFQNYHYFLSASPVLAKEFTLKEQITQMYQPENTTPVSIHIRRGDYVNNSFHPLCGLDYYKAAIDLISGKVHNPVFFVFSDDLDWVKKSFQTFEGRFEYVEGNTEAPAHDLIRMSSCQHNIIANSSFSWWAAWLNKTPKKIVITPKSWFNDPSWDSNNLILPGWIAL